MPYNYTHKGKTYSENDNSVIYPYSYKFKVADKFPRTFVNVFNVGDKRPKIDEKYLDERIKLWSFNLLDLDNNGELSRGEIDAFKKNRNRYFEYKAKSSPKYIFYQPSEYPSNNSY